MRIIKILESKNGKKPKKQKEDSITASVPKDNRPPKPTVNPNKNSKKKSK